MWNPFKKKQVIEIPTVEVKEAPRKLFVSEYPPAIYSTHWETVITPRERDIHYIVRFMSNQTSEVVKILEGVEPTIDGVNETVYNLVTETMKGFVQ